MDINEQIKELGIDEDKANALSDLFKNAISPLQDEVTKLSQVRDNLLQDKVKWKEQNESALSEADKIKNEALRQAGDFETLEANLRSQFDADLAKVKDQLAQKDNMILGKANEAVINSLSSEFVDPNLGKRLLKELVKTNFGEEGSTITDLDGVTDAAKFRETLESIEGFSSVLKGVDSSGGGGSGSKSGNGAPSGENSAFKQRLREAGLT